MLTTVLYYPLCLCSLSLFAAGFPARGRKDYRADRYGYESFRILSKGFSLPADTAGIMQTITDKIKVPVAIV